MSSLPGGTVTFLLTDIEDSSSQWEQDAEQMRAALQVHDALIAASVDDHHGAVIKHMGDGCWAAFASAHDAAGAAIEFRRRLARTTPEEQALLRVRIGLHTGRVDPTGDDYFGPVPNRSARVANLANGNQIVCSAATAGLLDAFDLESAGLHHLKGIGDEEIFLLRADGLEVDARALREPVTQSNLPQPRTSFVGRDREVPHLRALLADKHAVVTLVGPGGVGKTRLALEVGAACRDETSGTVLFVDLAVTDDDAFASTVAEAIGARQQPGLDLYASIHDYLRGRDVVLILDNAEHVVDRVRQLVDGLRDLDELLMIVTSREALHVSGEQLYLVSPLADDDAGVELFIDRARERNDQFDASDQESLRDIVRRLDGIPLAIELAAARTRLMTPTEMAGRLDDRFRLLGGNGDRDRHDTLHAAVSWSFRLLEPAEAALFTRLSVFNGGFDLLAVEDVCIGDDVSVDGVVELVASLVDKSMVVSTARNGRTRFHLLETLRSFGHAALSDEGEVDTYRNRHGDHYRRLAAEQQARLFTAAEPDAWIVLDAEWANLRTAFDGFIAASAIDPAADLVASLVWFAEMSMRYELFGWADEVLALDGGEDHPRYCDLTGAAAIGAYFTVSGDPTSIAERGLRANPEDPEGFCRTALAAVLLNNLHTPEASEQLTTDWLRSSSTSLGSQLWSEAFRTFHLCTHAPSPEAADHARAVEAIAQRTGSTTAQAMAAWARGQVVSYTDLDRAIQIWRDGLEWPRAMPSNHLFEHLLTGLLLHVTVRREDLPSAIEHCRDALQGAIDAHYFVGSSHLFGVTAIALCRADDPETAARLVGAMIGNGHIPRDNARRALAEALGDRVDDQIARGLSMGITEAGAVAVAALGAAAERLAVAAA